MGEFLNWKADQDESAGAQATTLLQMNPAGKADGYFRVAIGGSMTIVSLTIRGSGLFPGLPAAEGVHLTYQTDSRNIILRTK